MKAAASPAPEDGDPAADVVRIYFGASGAAQAVWRITPDHEPVLERPGAGAGSAKPILTRTIQSDRWLVWAPVPASAIEPDGRVRLGIVRERRLADGSIERTAWPRAMTPWQREPGRVAIDLTSWDGRSSP